MKTELAIEIPTRVIEKRRYFEISGTWNEARGVMPDTRVRKKVSTFLASMSNSKDFRAERSNFEPFLVTQKWTE